MKKSTISMKYHDYNGKQYFDLVFCCEGHEFVLVPLTKSKKGMAYFYCLLKDSSLTCERSAVR